MSPEDEKLLTLARAARGRIGAAQGAAVRDEMGRNYTGATVDLASLRLGALDVAIAQAVASGARTRSSGRGRRYGSRPVGGH